eukprot:Gregarina_sp_Poly_1__5463@NODE_2889_length_1582_cov_96_048845_g1825_i0_p1_GENE_NODE_2889_length_1582_cov_96_048845_g1825_i0NODE_2889_length_1582_cov_96_048845_g1825_i0_p1_ORF_typecomplete_len369_score43_88Bromo_TP/PF07524_13/0_057_NODE_2889_length_1582_cov_96_048845_g1825_i02591365
MPKTLRVYAGSELEHRYGENQYILRHLRKAVCWVASTQYNIHAFAETSVLDELAENVMTFLVNLGRQVSIVAGLAGRRQANFIDILNGLYINDRKLYKDFLDSGDVEFCAPQDVDDRALQIYVSLRLGRPLPADLISDSDNDGQQDEPLTVPSLINLSPTFQEVTLQRAITNLPQSPSQLGVSSQAPPFVSMQDVCDNPICALPVKPGSLTKLSDIVGYGATRAELSAIENGALAKLKNMIYKKEDQVVISGLKAGVLKRPASLASEQGSILLSLGLDSSSDGLALKGLPLPWPSDVPDWAPLLPGDGDSSAPTVSLATHISSFGGKGETACETQQGSIAYTDKTSLQLELCDIEPDYPEIREFNLTN